MHYFKEWSVQAAYTHTSREYDVQDTLSPKNTNIGSAYLHASTFLKDQNSNSAELEFWSLRNVEACRYADPIFVFFGDKVSWTSYSLDVCVYAAWTDHSLK